MPKREMAVDAAFLRLAERDQVQWVELEIRVQVEWADVMHLEVLGAAAQFTDGMQREVLTSDRRPMRRACMAERMLALGGID
jgi:hypothetical protein